MEKKPIPFEWVAHRISGALTAVRVTAGGVSPFTYLSPVCGSALSETRIDISCGLLPADAVYFRIVPENASPFRFLADAPVLAELCLTVHAKIRTAFRSVRRIVPRLFRIDPFNLRHLYRRERILRL